MNQELGASPIRTTLDQKSRLVFKLESGPAQM
jgi:hypothetical protein